MVIIHILCNHLTLEGPFSEVSKITKVIYIYINTMEYVISKITTTELEFIA